MYDYIRGCLEELSPAEAVVECHGIGFKLQISLNTYDRLQGQKDVKVYVHHHLREDEETLYGQHLRPPAGAEGCESIRPSPSARGRRDSLRIL